jgi:hypothetical protein
MPELRHDERLGAYRIEREIGRGGMGIVYLALDTRLQRHVALKLIAAELAADAGFRARFEREAHIAATLEHPHIVPVYEAGQLDGRLYIAMRHVAGADLGAVIRAEGPLLPRRVARLVTQLAGALDAAHRAGMVHRDVKPANVLLAGHGDDEHAFLTDFGLTRDAGSQGGVTRTGEWMGTVDYASPEQIRGLDLDARSDVYALGCVVFHALTGRPPYVGTPAAKLFGHVSGDVPAIRVVRPDVGGAIDAVVRRALAKDPAGRFPSSGDLARFLAAAVGGAEAVTTRLPLDEALAPTVRLADAAPVPGPARHPWRRRLGIAVAAASLVAAGAAAVVAAGQFAPSKGPDRSDRAAVAGNVAAAREKKKRKAERAATPQKRHRTESAPSRTTSAVAFVAHRPDSGTFSADVPSGGGWRVTGERELNPGLLRTTLAGPDGATLWIDVTPAEPPGFDTSRAEVISDVRLAGGIREIVFTGGGPDFCAADACVDYQIDLGDSGIAVLGGPGLRARAVARRVATSIEPYL